MALKDFSESSPIFADMISDLKSVTEVLKSKNIINELKIKCPSYCVTRWTILFDIAYWIVSHFKFLIEFLIRRTLDKKAKEIVSTNKDLLIRTFLNSAPRVVIVLLGYSKLISILESDSTQFAYSNFLISQAVEKMNEIAVGCDEETSSLIQSLGSLILERSEHHGGELSRAMFLLTKQGRNNYRETYLQAALTNEEENISLMYFLLDVKYKDVLIRAKFILENEEFLRSQLMLNENDYQAQFYAILHNSEALFVKKIENSDFEEEETIMEFEEFSTEDESSVVQEISIDPKFSVNQGPIKDALNIFYPIMLSLQWNEKEIEQFIVSFCNWRNLSLVDLELTEFYHCKDSVLWDAIGLNSDYNKLAELRNRLLCIPSSETTSERSLSLLKKIVNPQATRTSEKLEMAKVYMNQE